MILVFSVICMIILRFRYQGVLYIGSVSKCHKVSDLVYMLTNIYWDEASILLYGDCHATVHQVAFNLFSSFDMLGSKSILKASRKSITLLTSGPNFLLKADTNIIYRVSKDMGITREGNQDRTSQETFTNHAFTCIHLLFRRYIHDNDCIHSLVSPNQIRNG